LQSVTPLFDIVIKAYTGQVKDANLDRIPSYMDIPAKARVQLENTQNLKHIEALNLTLVYKRFYIKASALSGLNRNLGTGGDYIQFDNLFYKIVQVKYDFKTQWFAVVGAESDRLGE
jgi:hypothetical protein